MVRPDVLTTATMYRSGDRVGHYGAVLCSTSDCKNPATMTTFWASGDVIRHCGHHTTLAILAAAYATARHPKTYKTYYR